MTLIRAATGETQLPAPPRAPAPEDFPAVPALEPPRLPPAHGIRVAIAVTVAIVAAAGIRWLSAGSIETAPILFVAVVAAAWWLDRPAGVAVAVASGIAWTAAAMAVRPTVASAISAAALVASLVAIAIADAYEAMTTPRPYRRAVTPDAAVAELRACSGTQFDPVVVDAFIVELNVAPTSELEHLTVYQRAVDAVRFTAR